jgi:phosphoenolpyruvate-protein kinase (PTS system EI component)
MSAGILRGLAAAGGVAVGRALVLDEPGPEPDGTGGEAAQARAAAALEQVADELGRAADRLRALGRPDEAEIFDVNRLMAEDPTLSVEIHALAAERPAGAALIEATERHAAALAALPDPLLAARAADVRRLGRRAARLLAGVRSLEAPVEPAIIVARDLGPADVVDLDLAGGRIGGIALAEGAATSHAAIMARAFDLPMAVGLGDGLLAVRDGDEVVLDGDAGIVVLDPSQATRNLAAAATRRRARERAKLASGRTLPSVTRDGRRVTLLCNASTAAEVAAGVAAGAEGVGLLRTELAFLEATAWPSEDEHALALAPVIAALPRGPVTVRTLDFGADKTPPFLAGADERGLSLMLSHPGALAAQLGGILRNSAGTPVRILLPLVASAAEVRAARALLAECAEAVAWEGALPAIGAMIETPEAALGAAEIAASADFLSIGTNDLVQYTLGLDRTRPLATARASADPAVLALVAAVTDAAHAAGRRVEVCGEAAGEPPLVALLVGLGVDELSVVPAGLDEVRAVVRALSAESAAATARRALSAGSAAEALELAGELLGELLGERRQGRNRRGGVLA